jgi:hypothetical protein
MARRWKQNTKSDNGVITPLKSRNNISIPISISKEEEERAANAASPRKVPETSETLIAELSADDLYRHIDVPREYAKAQRWIERNKPRKFTRKFFERWLDKIEAPVVEARKTNIPCPEPFELPEMRRNAGT